MEFLATKFSGLIVITPRVFEDSRGYFFESFNLENFAAAGINLHWVQDNQSKSTYGVIRGLHYQLAPFSQSKLVRVLSGTILDVALDIRRGSPTFGQHFAIELSEANKKQLLIPHVSRTFTRCSIEYPHLFTKQVINSNNSSIL